MAARKKQKVSGRESVPNAPSRVWPRYAAQIAALWILAFLAYSNSIESGLVFDNAAIIGHDPRIRALTPETLGLIFTKEYWYPATNSGLYRPFTILSYLLNYSVFDNGPNPPGYHLVNLALHDLNIALVYALGFLILGGAVPAFALAALWAVHPLLTESVTNIVGRADLLAAFGILAGLLCHVHAAGATGRKRVAWLAALAGAQTIGLFSKESAAILPGVMALYDFIFARDAWRRRILNYAALIVPFAAFFYLRSQVDTHLSVTVAVNPLIAAGFWTARMTAVKVMGKLLWLFCWPARLTVDYSFNAVPLFAWRPLDWAALLAVAACAGLIAVAIRFRQHRPIVFFVGLCFMALAPSSNLLFPIGTIMAERFMYVPSIALCGCVVAGVQAIGSRPGLKWAALAVVCLAFGVRTYARNFDWRDGVTLWSSAAEAYPDCARAHFNLGEAWVARSEIPNAVGEFEAALRILPDYPHARFSLANELAKMPGRLPEAIGQYEAALQQDPNFAEAHYNLGTALVRAGRAEDAVAEWQTAVRIKPDFAEAHYNLATVYSQVPRRLPDAVAEYQAALRARADYVDAHVGLGNAYMELNRVNDAIAEYQAALRIRPDSVEARNSLGNALSTIPGRLEDAIAQYAEAIRLRPDLGEPHYRMGMALLRVPGRMPDALAELETALRLNPNPQGQKMVEELRARLR